MNKYLTVRMVNLVSMLPDLLDVMVLEMWLELSALVSATVELLVLLGEMPTMKDLWRFVWTVNGEASAILAGTVLMPLLPADQLASLLVSRKRLHQTNIAIVSAMHGSHTCVKDH